MMVKFIRKQKNGCTLLTIILIVSLIMPVSFTGMMEKAYAAEILFDDFEDGNSTGWTVVNGSWSVVTEGTNKVYKQSDTTGEGLTISGNSTWADYTIESQLTAYEMISTAASGIAARYQDSNNYYLFRLHQSGKAQLYKKSAGTFTLLQEAAQTYQANTSYTLKLVVQGSSLTGYVNGVEKVSATDTTHTSGKIGIRSFKQSVSIDNMSVTDSAALPEVSTNVALNKAVTASSILNTYTADKAVDGVISNDSRWVSANVTTTHTLEIDLGANYELACAHVHQGWNAQDPIANFSLQYWNGSAWVDMAAVINNSAINLSVELPSTPNITTGKVRLLSDDDGNIRVKELKIFNNSTAGCPVLETGAPTPTPAPTLPPETDIFINLSGYNVNKTKRFTSPDLPDGTSYEITKAGQTTVLYSGTITNHIGDFSGFNPNDAGEYVIKAGGKESYPFFIAPNWIEKVSYQNAVDFMIDSRCYVGTHNSCTNAIAWRDSHQFAFEIQSMIEQYFSNPSAYERMPGQVSYVTGYGELNPFSEQAPDIIKLIHWGIDRYMTVNVNHTLFKEQLAYFLFAYPELKEYISEADYQAVLAYTFNLWGDPNRDRFNWYDINHTADLFQTYTVIGTGKGQFPPGHSIIPNLMMYEVALREGRTDAQNYFNAAYNNAEWIINNLDWTDPTTTKGQRMSERITIQALSYFQKQYPGLAPAGLLTKIDQWVDVMIARSNNLWDFRKYSDTAWVIPGFNEPGNVMGFPAAAFAAIEVIGDTGKKNRLRELAMAHIDNTFGRNPTGRHFSHDANQFFEGVETGWYSEHQGGAGQLNAVRGVFDGSPKEAHYPTNVPDAGNVEWTEGWINFNTAWNSSLAYMANHDTEVKVFDSGFGSQPTSFAYNDTIGVQLTAPLNFDYAAVESGHVILTSSNGDKEKLQVNETSISSFDLRNTIQIVSGTASAGDNKIQVPAGGWFEVAYGFGQFKHKVIFVENGGVLARQ